MRTQFADVASRKEAKAEMAWAGKIVKVEGGYMGFETADDYKAWKNQE